MLKSTSELLELAVERFRAGDFVAAEKWGREVVAQAVDCAPGWQLLGVIAAQQGKLDAAHHYLQRTIEIDRNSADAHFQLAIILKGRQQISAAVQHCQQAVRIRPNYTEAHIVLGNLLSQQGETLAAIDCYSRAIEIEPGHAPAYNNRANAYTTLRRYEEAEKSYREAIRLQPNYPLAMSNLANVLVELNKLDEAIDMAQQALQLRPEFPGALNNLGNAWMRKQDWHSALPPLRRAVALDIANISARVNLSITLEQLDLRNEAIENLRTTLAAQPNSLDVMLLLAELLTKQGALDEAMAIARRAEKLQPARGETQLAIGNIQGKSGDWNAALRSFQEAARLAPHNVAVHRALANAYVQLRRWEQAAEAYQSAIQLAPDDASTHCNLSFVHQQQGNLEAARTSILRAIELQPDHAEAHNDLGNVLLRYGDVPKAITSFRRALELKPDLSGTLSNCLLCEQYLPDVTCQRLAIAHAEWENRFGAPLFREFDWSTHDRRPDRRLRIGLVSGDLLVHPVGILTIQAFERLSHRAELVAYSDTRRRDSMTERFQATVATWRETAELNDEQLHAQIRADQIDILFDLAGHTAHNRLLVFARSAAPVQISWAGYVGTTGLRAMDYVLADRFLAPPRVDEFYSEHILRMPNAYVCYEPPAHAPRVGPLPVLANGHITFGSFSNPAKLSLPVIQLWSTILSRLPQSRLMLKYRGLNDPSMVERLGQQFARFGIERSGLEFHGRSPHQDLLDHYNRVDLALDTFPYGGGLTTCEALWMGVPVITCPGNTFASRHALSHLMNAGLPETIADSFEQYVEICVDWANDLERLVRVRSGLRAQMAASPLCDGDRFSADLFEMLHGLWRKRLASR